MRKSLHAASSAVIAGALLISAQPVLDSTAAAAETTQTPNRYLAQRIDWKPCFDPNKPPPNLPPGAQRMECGSFIAPRDWNRPGDKQFVSIAVSRLAPESGDAPRGSLLTNPGGPGGPGRTLPLTFLQKKRTKLLNNFEVIGIDVRGTGDSTNITCDGAGATGSQLDPRDRSPENLDAMLDAAQRVAEGCQQASGELGGLVNTEQTVKDLDLLRQLLGREKVNWVGYSGGSWLGAYYATYFPNRVDKFVLDSNTEFTTSWQESFGWQPLGFERRMAEDFQPWAAEHAGLYKLGTTGEEVRRTYDELRARVAKEPVWMPGYGEIDHTILDSVAISAMYSKTQFPTLAAGMAYLQQLIENPETAATHQSVPGSFASLLKNHGKHGLPVAADAMTATFNSILCNDTAWDGSREELLKESDRLYREYPFIGAMPLNWPCRFWDRPVLDMPTPDGEGVPPVLMVQSENDAATPMEGAQRAHEAFAGSRLLTVRNEGDHGVYAANNPCVDNAVEAYLVDGTVPDKDITCEGMPIPEPPPAAAAMATAGTMDENPLFAAQRYREITGPLPR